MRIIINESQHSKIIDMISKMREEEGEYFYPTIYRCNKASDIPEWVKASIHDNDDMWEKYIDAFGTIYIILNDDDWFIAQYHDHDGWRIGDKNDEMISEFEMMKQLGIAKYGVNIENILGI